MIVAINEIFETIQGEAKFTGTPSVFVRLQYCDVGCAWCDTKHTWELGTFDQIPFGEMLNKGEDSPKYALAEVNVLVAYLISLRPNHIVITGGEPCVHDLSILTSMLIAAGKSVQIETSGTYEILCHPRTWVTVSPKIGMAGKKEVLQSALQRANEIKHPIGKAADVQNLKSLSKGLNKVIWMQPLSQSEKATQLCIDTAMQENWNLSIQTHKFIGVR